MASLPSDWAPAAGAPWDVHRRWVTRLGRENLGRRLGKRFRRGGSGLDVPGSGCISGLDDILIGIAVVIVVVVLVVFVAPLVFVAVELLLVGLAVLLGLVAKVVFRRPWAVDAFGADGTHLRWKAVGWRATTRQVDEVVAALQENRLAPGVELVHAVARPQPAPAPAPPWDGANGPFGSA